MTLKQSKDKIIHVTKATFLLLILPLNLNGKKPVFKLYLNIYNQKMKFCGEPKQREDTSFQWTFIDDDVCIHRCFSVCFLHYVLRKMIIFAKSFFKFRVKCSISPAACSSRRLDGVDPEAVGDVPQHLDCLLVRFVVILHEGKVSSSAAPDEVEEQKCFVCCKRWMLHRRGVSAKRDGGKEKERGRMEMRLGLSCRGWDRVVSTQ